jgi:hypothetical protein
VAPPPSLELAPSSLGLAPSSLGLAPSSLGLAPSSLAPPLLAPPLLVRQAGVPSSLSLSSVQEQQVMHYPLKSGSSVRESSPEAFEQDIEN